MLNIVNKFVIKLNNNVFIKFKVLKNLYCCNCD